MDNFMIFNQIDDSIPIEYLLSKDELDALYKEFYTEG